MKEAMDIVRDRQRMETSYFNLIVTIGLTDEQEEKERLLGLELALMTTK